VRGGQKCTTAQTRAPQPDREVKLTIASLCTPVSMDQRSVLYTCHSQFTHSRTFARPHAVPAAAYKERASLRLALSGARRPKRQSPCEVGFGMVRAELPPCVREAVSQRRLRLLHLPLLFGVVFRPRRSKHAPHCAQRNTSARTTRDGVLHCSRTWDPARAWQKAAMRGGHREEFRRQCHAGQRCLRGCAQRGSAAGARDAADP